LSGVHAHESEFDAIAGWVCEEQLNLACVWNMGHFILDTHLREPGFEFSSTGAVKRRVVETGRRFVSGRFTTWSLAEMQNGLLAGVEPVPEGLEWWTMSDLEAHHLDIERPQLIEQLSRSAQVVVTETKNAHVDIERSA